MACQEDSASDTEGLCLEPRYLTLSCDRCGRVAAEFALLPPGFGAEGDLWRGEYRLQRTGFIGSVTTMTAAQELERMLDALERRDFRAVWDIDGDAGGFYCPDCKAVYCDQCWDIEPPTFADDFPGFYDYTEATCPEGHRHIVDD